MPQDSPADITRRAEDIVYMWKLAQELNIDIPKSIGDAFVSQAWEHDEELYKKLQLVFGAHIITVREMDKLDPNFGFRNLFEEESTDAKTAIRDIWSQMTLDKPLDELKRLGKEFAAAMVAAAEKKSFSDEKMDNLREVLFYGTPD